MNMEVTWQLKPFDKLTISELYDILYLRSEVFVVEQQCVFLDVDFKDQLAHHLMGLHNNKLAAYTRLFNAGITYQEASIGRVVTAPFARNSGIGKNLMTESINQLYTLFGKQPIRIGAQLYLKKFYESFGFQQDSEMYLEDGIEHIEMLLR
jgi:ElaA protein